MEKPIFKDSYGNEVNIGDKIIIESNYNFQHYNGKECDVFFDQVHGMFKFKFEEKSGWGDKTHTTESNFYGIYSFKKI